jgi:Ala-tRNA(Pro) deacylase
MTCLDRLEGYLHEHTVPFQLQHHYRATTAQQVAASEHISGKMMAKVVLAFADGQLIMLVLPASHQVDFLKMALALEAHQVRLATEREFGGVFPDCEIGAMPPFGNLYGVPVYVDRALTTDEVIVFQAGTHTETIGMLYRDYAALVQPLVVDLVRDPLPPAAVVTIVQLTV